MRDFIDLSADAARPVFLDPSAVTLIELTEEGHALTVYHAKGGKSRLVSSDGPFDAELIGRRLHNDGSGFAACGANAFVSLRDLYFIGRGAVDGEGMRQMHLGLRQLGNHSVTMPLAEAEELVTRALRVKTMHKVGVRAVSGVSLPDREILVQAAAIRFAQPAQGERVEAVFGTKCLAVFVPLADGENVAGSFNAACTGNETPVANLIQQFARLAVHLDVLNTVQGSVLVSRQDVQMAVSRGENTAALDVCLGGVLPEGSLQLELQFESDFVRDNALRVMQHAQADEERLMLRQSCR